MDGFRPGGNLAFDRLSDGSVVLARLEKTANKKERVRFSYIIAPDVWAELIAYVSKGGHPSSERLSSNTTPMQYAKYLIDQHQPVSPGAGIKLTAIHLAEAFHAGRVESWRPLPS